MNEFLKSRKSYIFYCLLVVAFYWDTQNAGFVTDFLGWQTSFDNNSFWDIIHASDRGIKSFYHLTHLQLYVLSALFRTWGLPWFLVFSSLFAFNAWLVVRLTLNILSYLRIENKEGAVFIGILCFILSPYQAEVMVWRASFHYLTAFAMLLTFLNLLQSYLSQPNKKTAIYANVLFFASMFALEFFFLTPFLALILILFYHYSKENLIQLRQTLTRFVAVPLLCLSFYFCLFYVVYGKWIAHYGASAHSKIISLASFSTYAKYIVKHLFFVRYYHIFDYNTQPKIKIYAFFDQPIVAWSLVVLISVFSVYKLLNFKKIPPLSKFTFLHFILFSLFLVPVVTMFFYDLYLTENDRLGFMASAFLFVGISLALSNLPKKFFFILSILYLAINVFFLIKTTHIWFKSERVYTNLVKNYKWWDADEVLILNLPDNFNGMYLFRHRGAVSALPESLEAYHKRKISAKMVDIKRYNLMDDNNGVHVKVDSINHFTVKLNQFGNWWFYESDKSTESFDVKDIANGFQLVLKPTIKKRVILFQTGWEWKEVDLIKVGVEQR